MAGTGQMGLQHGSSSAAHQGWDESLSIRCASSVGLFVIFFTGRNPSPAFVDSRVEMLIVTYIHSYMVAKQLELLLLAFPDILFFSTSMKCLFRNYGISLLVSRALTNPHSI